MDFLLGHFSDFTCIVFGLYLTLGRSFVEQVIAQSQKANKKVNETSLVWMCRFGGMSFVAFGGLRLLGVIKSN